MFTTKGKNSIVCPLLLLVAALLSSLTATTQTSYHAETLTTTLNGTSNIHDWEMKTSAGSSEATFAIDAHGKLTSVSKLSFTVPSNALKSEHTGMDNNTYKALKSAANPHITFILTSGIVKQTSPNNYLLTIQGRLNIAGKTNLAEILATGLYNPADKSFIVSGVKKMKMTDYGVTPPRALFGTIRTGNDISIAYTLKFIR